MSSPFETLGLLPSLVAELNEQQLKEVVAAADRAFRPIFHPDRAIDDQTLRAVLDSRTGLIANAAAHLRTDPDIREAKAKYVNYGPGQQEVRAAETDLLTLQHRSAALEENIKKTSRKIEDLLHNTIIEESYWVETFYSDLSGGADSDSLYLRYTPGLKFVYFRDIIQDPRNKLSIALENEPDQWNIDVEKQDTRTLKNFISRIRDASKRDEASVEEIRQMRIKEEQLKRLLEQKRNRETETKKLKKLALKKRVLREGKINADGYIILGGRNTGLRVAGDLHGLVTASFMDVRPEIRIGGKLVGFNETGKLVEIGIIQEYKVSNPIRILIKQREEYRKQQHTKKTGRNDSALPSKKPEESKETALATIGQVQISYEKNPFETLGLLPSLVQELSVEDLRKFVNAISKTLLRVSHPEYQYGGGDSTRFNEINKALSILENPERFEMAKQEYGKLAAGSTRIKAIEQLMQEIRERSSSLIDELAQKKIEEARAGEFARNEKSKFKVFLDLLLGDIFFSSMHPAKHPDALYLHKSSKATLAVLSGHDYLDYRMEVEAFDAFASLDQSKIWILGSTIPGMFKTFDEVERMIHAIRDRCRELREDYAQPLTPLDLFRQEIYRHVHPVLYPKSFLIGAEQNCPKVLGMIERIDIQEGKKMARKLSNGLKEQRQMVARVSRRS